VIYEYSLLPFASITTSFTKKSYNVDMTDTWHMIEEPFKTVEKQLLDLITSIEIEKVQLNVKNLINRIVLSESPEVQLITEHKARSMLKTLGIVITREGFVFISNKNAELQKRLDYICAHSWNQSLKNLAGSRRSLNPKKFGKTSYRGLLIPLSHFVNNTINTKNI
jgi:hypothetical protein